MKYFNSLTLPDKKYNKCMILVILTSNIVIQKAERDEIRFRNINEA